MKKLVILVFIILLVIGAVFAINYISLQSIVDAKLSSDYRNEGVKISIHYKNYVQFTSLVFDVKKVDGKNSPADVFRVFLQSASSLKDKRYSKVELDGYGKSVFYITGEYFNKLGSEYSFQNALYTMRTFPENLYLMNGDRAYNSVDGGLFGVLNAQSDNFKDAYTKWFIDK